MKFYWILAVAISFIWVTQAQPNFQQVVKWKNYPENANQYVVGEVVTLVFEAKINKGYHIYSAIPPEKDANMPTEFGLDKGTHGVVKVGDLTESGKKHTEYDSVFEANVSYYGDFVIFKQKLKITDPKIVIKGYIHYQVCDSQTCVPAYNDFSFTFTAKPANNKSANEPSDTTDSINVNPTNTASQNGSSDNSQQFKSLPSKETPAAEKSLFSLFWAAFAFGLVSLLTPCVFPMIPMTVSYFTKKQTDRATNIRNALFYSISIIFIYVGLGLLITLLFGSSAIYQMASNPWVNLLFFVIVFAFGLSFLGWFELALPSSWLTKLDSKSSTGSYSGIFFMALTLALVSFSCTGPIIGTLLVEASQGSYLGPTVGMFGFSLAFAFPFGLFSLFPHLITSLPSSGGWLNSVKVVLGFLEIALALKFLSNVDLVWHLGILDREVYLGAWIAIFLLLGIYLMGWYKLPHDSPIAHISIPRLLLAIVSFWFVFYMVPGLWGAPLKLLSGFLPPHNPDIGVVVWGKEAMASVTEKSESPLVCSQNRKYSEKLSKDTPLGFCAFYDLDEALAYAKKVDKPVFVDFTGHTCVNCRWMESNVWPDPAIKKSLNTDFILVSLFVDDAEPLPENITAADGTILRTVGDKWLQLQKERFQTNAQPYYVILDGSGNQLIPYGLGKTDIPTLQKMLQEAKGRYTKS